MTDEKKPERESYLQLKEVQIEGLDDEPRKFAENEIRIALSVLKALDTCPLADDENAETEEDE